MEINMPELRYLTGHILKSLDDKSFAFIPHNNKDIMLYKNNPTFIQYFCTKEGRDVIMQNMADYRFQLEGLRYKKEALINVNKSLLDITIITCSRHDLKIKDLPVDYKEKLSLVARTIQSDYLLDENLSLLELKSILINDIENIEKKIDNYNKYIQRKSNILTALRTINGDAPLPNVPHADLSIVDRVQESKKDASDILGMTTEDERLE
jgi:hypothetical protein